MNNMKIVDIFTTIVKIDSVSGNEQDMAIYIKNWLEKVGFKWKQDKLGSILAIEKGNDSPELLLSSHMDTVEPGNGINPIIKNDYIQSDGKTILGADNKSSISAIICAVEEYKEKNNKLPNIELLFSVKEETGGGLEFFPFEWVKSKVGLTFDYAKPFGKIVLSSPYIYNFKATFIGKSAHSSRPEEGVNSLSPAIKFMDKIKMGRFDKGETTINIGVVNSGIGINTVPNKTIVQGEIRSLNKNKFDVHIKELNKHVVDIKSKYPDVEIELKLDGYCSGYNHKEKDPFILKIISIYKKLSIETSFDKPTGISDANPLVNAGIQVVNLSDGVEDPHTTNEKISVKNLERLTEIVSTFLSDIG